MRVVCSSLSLKGRTTFAAVFAACVAKELIWVFKVHRVRDLPTI